MKKKPLILVSLLFVLILIQFFRVSQVNPAVNPAVDFQNVVPTATGHLALLRHACYDCHSNETQYPWYANVAPFSWRMSNHVKEGRKHLNFSEWGLLSAKKKADHLEDMEDAFSNGWMPLWDYKMMHSAANLSAAQRSEMAAWIKTLR